jgi:hypothetical protein
MKPIIILFCFAFTFQARATEIGNYKIREGKLHKGGTARVEVLSATERFVVKLSYELKKKPFVPVPESELKGESIMELPLDFQDERGYLSLEQSGMMEIQDAQVKHLKRIKVGEFDDGHLIEILPRNGKSRTEISYHSSIPAAGWWSIKIKFISTIPLLSGYVINAELIR